jgi:hypothetical protein
MDPVAGVFERLLGGAVGKATTIFGMSLKKEGIARRKRKVFAISFVFRQVRTCLAVCTLYERLGVKTPASKELLPTLREEPRP